MLWVIGSATAMSRLFSEDQCAVGSMYQKGHAKPCPSAKILLERLPYHRPWQVSMPVPKRGVRHGLAKEASCIEHRAGQGDLQTSDAHPGEIITLTFGGKRGKLPKASGRPVAREWQEEGCESSDGQSG